VDDVGFLSALIDTINRDYHINLRRVYSTGMSNGGFMSYRLACELSHRIAAIASVTGSMTDSMRTNCHSVRPVPVLHFHGTTDPVVNYNGAGNILSVDASLQYWINNNNCPVSGSITPLPDVVTSDNSTVTKLYWGLCDNQTEVEHYKVTGGGHTWPGSDNNFFGLVGNLNEDINASEIIWEFFNRHSLPAGFTSVNEVSSANNLVNVFPNPVANTLTIEWNEAQVNSVQITDLSGRIVAKTDVGTFSGSLKFSVADFSPGIYLIQCFTSQGISVKKMAKE
jgi:polyhydroxybutyrate depolymerase